MNNFSINPEYKPTEDPIKSRHDIKTTRESVKTLLANGTPDWVKFPNEYKAFVQESFAEEREISNTMVRQYKMKDQDILTDTEPRMVNILTTIDFYQRLKNNGVKCFTVYNGMPQTVGLWAVPKHTNEAKYICYMQVPCMYEWSVLRLDRHGLPNGEDYRGWRTVLSQLIVKEVLTEDQAHKIYGKPVEGNPVSKIYRQTLYNFRNGIGRSVEENSSEL